MLLIGSHALKYHFSLDRKPLDVDQICTIDEYECAVEAVRAEGDLVSAHPTQSDSMVVRLKSCRDIFEYSIAWPGSTNEELLTRYAARVAPPDVLLMLKLSHRYKKNSPHFLKTMRDIQFLRSKGVTLGSELKTLLKRREKETYNYAHPSLMQGKKSFFKESAGLYVYEHDDIHDAVAVGDVPAYKLFSEDGMEVAVSKKKWKSLDFRVQLLAGLEESYVLALERSLIPHPGVLTPKQAFDKALEKVCTSITSGWFREFCWENYDAIQELYDESFVEKFNKALVAGKIRRFNELV